MKIVGNNLNSNNRISLSCDSSIPDTINNIYNSACYSNKQGNLYKQQLAYTKEYVESVYKDIYGEDSILDTSVPIVGVLGIEAYYYIEDLQKYVLYEFAGGGGCAFETTIVTLTKAVQIDKEIKLYENVIEKNLETNTIEKEYTVVYTFKLEEDGMYSFYSRVKE